MMNNSDIDILCEKQIWRSYYPSSPVVDSEVMEKIENVSVNLTARNNQENLNGMYMLNILITIYKIY